MFFIILFKIFFIEKGIFINYLVFSFVYFVKILEKSSGCLSQRYVFILIIKVICIFM